MTVTQPVAQSLSQPTFGHNRLGHAVHARTVDHLPVDSAYQRFNKKIAIAVTERVGTMTCAWIFSLISLCSLPAVLSQFSAFKGVFPSWMISASLIALISWIAQTYIQLVLLSVIMVGQSVQSTAADARAVKTFEDVENVKDAQAKALDALDTHTAGGLAEVIEAINALRADLAR